jgi:hypothetical protein
MGRRLEKIHLDSCACGRETVLPLLLVLIFQVCLQVRHNSRLNELKVPQLGRTPSHSLTSHLGYASTIPLAGAGLPGSEGRVSSLPLRKWPRREGWSKNVSAWESK